MEANLSGGGGVRAVAGFVCRLTLEALQLCHSRHQRRILDFMPGQTKCVVIARIVALAPKCAKLWYALKCV